MDTVAQVVSEWLPPTESFVYVQVAGVKRFRSVVLTRRRRDTPFDFEPVVELTPTVPIAERALRRLRAMAAGSRHTFDHRLIGAAARSGARVLHAHHGHAGCEALDAARTLGLPLITSFYGRDQSAVGRYAELFEHGAFFLCLGPRMAERLREMGCPAERTRTVPIAIDLSDLPYEPRRRSRPLVVMQASRLVEKK